jgi:phytoene desaturase
MPTRTDPSVAPPGCATFYVLAPVPNLAAPVDWEHVAPRYREGLLRFLEERFLPDLRRHLLFVHHVDPRHFARAYNTHLGTGFTLQPVFTQSAWFRPHNRSGALRGLYLVGAGTHPGPGLPGVLLSARITQALVEEELSR